MNETEAIKSALIKTTVEKYIETVYCYDTWYDDNEEFANRMLVATSLSVLASLMISEKVDFIYPNNFKSFGVN